MNWQGWVSTIGVVLTGTTMLIGGIMWLRKQTRLDAVNDQRILLVERWIQDHKTCHDEMRRNTVRIDKSLSSVEAKVDILLERLT